MHDLKFVFCIYLLLTATIPGCTGSEAQRLDEGGDGGSQWVGGSLRAALSNPSIHLTWTVIKHCSVFSPPGEHKEEGACKVRKGHDYVVHLESS